MTLRATQPARAVVLVTAFAVALGAQLVVGAAPARAAGCQTTPRTGYTVEVCLLAPADGAALTGTVPVTATVSVGGANPASVAVESVVFTWNDGYLLTDHDADYRMTLRSSRLPNGTGTFGARAVMTDGSGTPTNGVSVSVANPPTPPSTGQFTPHLGTASGPGGRFRIAAVGDGVDGSPAAAAVVNLIGS